jgi:hypothetical protein
LRALQEFRGLNFWKGTAANFDGHFTMKSYKISENKKELKESTIEFPKYHLKIRTEDRKIERYKATKLQIAG